MDDISTLIEQAKRQKKTAETVELMQDPEIQNLMGTGEKAKVTAYERAAETITDGLHKVKDAKAVLQHAHIPTKVLPPVLEIIIATESMIEELKKFASQGSLDPLTLEENRILVQEATRIMEAIPLVLTAKDGFRAMQAVENLRSVVTGQSLIDANQAAAFNGSAGVIGTLKKWFMGSKRK